MPRITISYRRDDSLDITGRIFDRLALHFGREAVFRDIDNIPPGVDFRRHLETTLDTSDIILAIVGPHWVGPSAEQSRFASVVDPVRVEIEIALRTGKPVIPVLVSHAVMPNPEHLPESLSDFAYRNAVQIDGGMDFDVHVGRLIHAMDGMLEAFKAQVADEAIRAAIAAVDAAPQRDTPQFAPSGVPESAGSSIAPVAKANRAPHRLILAALTILILALIGAGGWWVFVEQPAEIARREAAAAEKALADQQARQAAAAKAQQAEAARQAAIDKARQDETLRQAAAAADTAPQDEQSRQAAAAEKARQDQQALAAPPPNPAPVAQAAVVQAPAAPPTAEPDPRDTVRSLQTELHRVGCYSGAIDGIWGPGTAAALQRFNQRAGTSVDTQAVSLAAVTVVHERTERVCPLSPPTKPSSTRQAVQDEQGSDGGTHQSYQPPAYQAPAAGAYQPPAYQAPATGAYQAPAYQAPAYQAPAAPRY